MNELRLLINALNQHLSLKKRHWKKMSSNLSPLESELLSIFLNDPNATDEIAAKKIFKTDFKDRNYQRLRTSLNQDLTTQILLFSTPKSKEPAHVRILQKGNRLHAILKVLIPSEHHELTKIIADKLYNLSVKHTLSEYGFASSHYLHKYHSVLYPNTSKADKYRNETFKYALLQEAENKIELYWNDLNNSRVSNLKNNSDFIKKIKSQLKEIEEFRKRGVESQKFFILSNQFYISYYELNYGHKKAKEAALESLEIFDKLQYECTYGKSTLLASLAHSYLALGDLDNAKDSISKSIDLEQKKSPNWYTAKRILIKIAMAQRDYDIAFNHYISTIKSDELKLTIPEQKFHHIVRPYMRFLLLTGRLQAPSEYQAEIKHTNFKESIAKLENGSPLIKPYLFSELMICIFKHKKKSAEIQLDLLRDHAKLRVKKSSANYRCNSFIKTVECLTSGHFHPNAVKRHAKKYVNQLSSVEFEISDKNKSPELIPYEHMWEMILEDLESWKN